MQTGFTNQPIEPDPKTAALTDVFAPKIVGVPPSNAVGNLVQLPDGALRCYSLQHERTAETAPDGGVLYLESRDHGLTWKRGTQRDYPGIPLAHSPVSGDYYGLSAQVRPVGNDAEPSVFYIELTVCRSRTGIEGIYEKNTIELKEQGDLIERFTGVRPRFFDVLIGDPIRRRGFPCVCPCCFSRMTTA